MRIVFLSHTSAHGIFRVGSHHLSRELARRGHEVTHVSSPFSLLHLARAKGDPQTRVRLNQARVPLLDDDGVAHVVPWSLLPAGRTPPYFRRAEARLRMWRWARRHPLAMSPDVVFLDQPLLVEFAEQLSAATVIYRPTDAHFDPVMRRAELRALEIAGGVAATSHQTLNSVVDGTTWEGPTAVIENGVEIERFSPAPEIVPTPRVVYLGALDHRFDWELLATLAREFVSSEFVIAGPLPAEVPAHLPSNVVLLGPVPYADAPALLRTARVGILPLTSHPSNAGRSPMKYYEYLASGLAVVASRVPALSSRSTPNVWLYGDAAEASVALRSALATTREAREAGITAAQANSWSAGAERLERFATAIAEGTLE